MVLVVVTTVMVKVDRLGIKMDLIILQVSKNSQDIINDLIIGGKV